MLKLCFLFSYCLFFLNWYLSLISLCFVSFFFIFYYSEFSLSYLNLFSECDFMGEFLVFLSIWLIIICFLGSKLIYKINLHSNFFIFSCIFMMLSLFFSFLVSSFLYFYISFETCLVPIFLILAGWGYQPERVNAGYYLLFYTMLGSLPLFFLILYYSSSEGVSYMYSYFSFCTNSYMYLFMTLAFLIKFPLYGFHLWLLKAHVEAPVAGSMLLAGILLKLGGYGLIRIFNLLEVYLGWLNEFIMVFALFGGLIVSLSCLCYMDMKILIASSSVVHMSLCIAGLYMFSMLSYKACFFMMVAHGLCSSGLFYLANTSYERLFSRSFLVVKGLISYTPGLSLLWFFMCSSNLAAPPTFNLLSEVFLMISIINYSPFFMFLLGGLSFFSAGYSLYLFYITQHGGSFNNKASFSSGVFLEYFVSFIHLYPILVLVLGGTYLI